MKILMLVNWKVAYENQIPEGKQPPDYVVPGQKYWFFRYLSDDISVDVVDIRSFPWLERFEKEKTPHPTQKPESLIMELIKAFCPKDGEGHYNGTILDPFHGSGTLGVCCEKLNAEGHHIKWLGIELEQQWCDIAEQRIADIEK